MNFLKILSLLLTLSLSSCQNSNFLLRLYLYEHIKCFLLDLLWVELESIFFRANYLYKSEKVDLGVSSWEGGFLMLGHLLLLQGNLDLRILHSALCLGPNSPQQWAGFCLTVPYYIGQCTWENKNKSKKKPHTVSSPCSPHGPDL